jgi:transposase
MDTHLIRGYASKLTGETMKQQKKSYSEEFKQQAVELAEGMGNVCAAAKQLGISDSLIHAWRRQKVISKDKKIVALSDSQQENQRLRKENVELKKVNHILKAAAAFFSQDHLK